MEPDIAVASTGLVVSAFMAQGPGSIGYTFSRDKGRTWDPPQTIPPPANGQTADPSLAVGGAAFLLTWLAWAGGPRTIYAATAPPGSTTFGTPVEVSDPAAPMTYDKPWALVLADGTSVVVYTTDSANAVYVARSADRAHWTRSTIAPDATLRGVAFACATTARLYVTYLVPGGIGLSYSDDGGVTWPAAYTTVVEAPGEHTAFDMPTCVANASNLWISYGLTTDASTAAQADRLTAIRIARSMDGGRTIAWRTTVGDGHLAMHPRLVRDATATLHLLYYDDDAAILGSFRHTRSPDEGQTWTAGETVGPPIRFFAARTGLDWLGDYVGAATLDGDLYAAYVQNLFDGGSISHVAFARVDPP